MRATIIPIALVAIVLATGAPLAGQKAMCDPRQPPYVSHARGTELVIEHIERYWCPSIRGEDLTRVVPGSDGP